MVNVAGLLESHLCSVEFIQNGALNTTNDIHCVCSMCIKAMYVGVHKGEYIPLREQKKSPCNLHSEPSTSQGSLNHMVSYSRHKNDDEQAL